MPATHPLHKDGGSDIASRNLRGRRSVTDEWALVEFRPARWLVAALALLALWLVRPMLGKRALLALAWRFAPRRLRLIAGGLAALAVVVIAASVATLVLILDQL